MALRDVALVLGPVAFQSFEIPAQINFGGVQRLAVHDIPGGQRVIDAIGPKPADIAWSGIFAGTDATVRARALDTLRSQGAVLNLSWDVFFFTVVIRAFEAEFHNTAWVPYRLSVTVLQDSSIAAAQAIDALAGDVLGDAEAAAPFAGSAGVSLGALQIALGAPGAAVLGTAAYLAATAGLSAARSDVQTQADAADQAIDGYAQNGIGGAADVTGLTASAADAANAATANAYLGRIGANLANAGT